MPVSDRQAEPPGLADILLERLAADIGRTVLVEVGADGVSRPLAAAALLAEVAAGSAAVAEASGPDAIIAIASRQPARQAAAWLSVLAAGRLPCFLAPPSPHMDPAKQRRDRAGMMAAAGIALLADDAGLQEAGGTQRIAWPDPPRTTAPPALRTAAARGGRPVLVQHSSGTTGRPKGIALTTEQVLEHAAAYAGVTGLAAGHRVVSWLPLYHDMGFVACFLMPLLLGIPYVQIDPFHWAKDPLLLWEKLREHGGSHVWLPNFAFALFARLAPQAAARGISLAGLQMLVNCSETVSPRSIDEFAAAYRPFGLRQQAIHACYAMAENVFAVTQTAAGPPSRVAADRRRAEREGRILPAREKRHEVVYVSSGRPLPTTRLRIVDGAGIDLPEGRVGDIRVAGSHCIDGYMTAPAGRAAAFRDGWYHTGDRGFLMAGELYVIGREAEFVIVNGRNVPLQEIEAAADTVAGVHRGRTIALAVYDQAAGSERPVMIAEAEDPALAARPDDAPARALGLALRRRIRETLDIAPGDVRIVPARWIVKSTSGKKARTATLAKYIAAFRPDLLPPEE